MGNKLKLTFLLLACLSISPVLSFAALTGSKHDMFVQGKGTSPDICSYCHIPHNAIGEKIWSNWKKSQMPAGYTTIGNMCYTCHDGTVTNLGQATAFNSSLQQHKIPAGSDCDMCHSVHDNANGSFMNLAQISEYTYCPSCHNAAVNAGGLGDHVNKPGNHQNCNVCHTGADMYYISGSVDDSTCHLCHARAHGAVNYSAPGVANPILKESNTDSYICVNCHPMAYQGASGGKRHPSSMSSAGAYGKLICQTCHDAHQPGVTDHPALLTEPNIDSQMCINCHDGTSGPAIGHSHPNQVGLGDIVPKDASAATGTPLGNQINDNYYPYFTNHKIWDSNLDYPANSASVICETCHSVHRKADDQGTKLLRITNTNSALCLNCHQM